LAAIGVDGAREHCMNDRRHGDDDLSFETLREYGRNALRIATTRH
jgi:hypothetical protein